MWRLLFQGLTQLFMYYVIIGYYWWFKSQFFQWPLWGHLRLSEATITMMLIYLDIIMRQKWNWHKCVCLVEKIYWHHAYAEVGSDNMLLSETVKRCKKLNYVVFRHLAFKYVYLWRKKISRQAFNRGRIRVLYITNICKFMNTYIP